MKNEDKTFLILKYGNFYEDDIVLYKTMHEGLMTKIINHFNKSGGSFIDAIEYILLKENND